MRRALIPYLCAAALSCSGCVDDKGAELAKCAMQAEQHARPSPFGSDHLGAYAKTCMRAKGYVVQDPPKQGCWDLLVQEACYSSHHFWDDLLR